MSKKRRFTILLLLIAMFSFLGVQVAFADEGGGSGTGIDMTGSLYASCYTVVCGDYVAAGVGMRGTGSGTIAMSGVPSGSTIVKAFLYWAIIDDTEGTNFKNGVVDGTPITGTLIGTDDDPCWTPQITYAYRADATALVRARASANGAYSLSGFATGPALPQNVYGEATTAPLNEGASLVVVFSNPASAIREIVIYDGADTIDSGVSSVSTVMTGFTASAAPSAKTTYIVADGQDHFSDDTVFNGVTIASDLSSLGDTTSFEGSDGKLWDTDTYDVSTYVSAGDTSITVKLQRGTDCLVHIAQVFSVTTTVPKSVIPEVPLGTIVASASMIIALVAYVAMPRFRKKQININP